MTWLGDLFLTVFIILLEKGCEGCDGLDFFHTDLYQWENNSKVLGLFAVSTEDQLINISCDLTT